MKKKILVCIILIASALLTACGGKTHEGEPIFPTAGKAKPETVTLGRNAVGDEITGAESDTAAVTVQATSDDGKVLMDFLSHFTYGKSTKAKDDVTHSEYTFTVNYSDGSTATCGLEYAQKDGRTYTVSIAPEAAGHSGIEVWHRQLAVAVGDRGGATAIWSALSSANRYRFTSEGGSYIRGEYEFPLEEHFTDLSATDLGVLIPLECGGVYNTEMPSVKDGGPLLTVRAGGWFDGLRAYISDDCMEFEIGKKDSYGYDFGSYRCVPLPTLTAEEGAAQCTVNYNSDTFADKAIAAYRAWADENPPESLDYFDPTEYSEYDWEGHLFTPEDGKIVRIVYKLDSYGKAATGIPAIDHVSVDISTVTDYYMSSDDTTPLEEGIEWLYSLVPGEPVAEDEDHPVKHTVVITYADGREEEHSADYVEIDGTAYYVESKKGAVRGYGMTDYDLWHLKVRNDAMLASDTVRAPIERINEFLTDPENTVRTLNTDGTVHTVDTVEIHPDVLKYYLFTEEVEKPTVTPDEILTVAAKDGSAVLRAYVAGDSILEWTENGTTRYFRTVELDFERADPVHGAAESLIYTAKQALEQQTEQ